MIRLSRHGARSRGFSLVEFILALAILGMLAVIVLPAFWRDREVKYQSTCTGHARAFALAVLQYSQDNDKCLVPIRSHQYGQSDWVDLLRPYSKTFGMYACPSDRRSHGFSYGLNKLAFPDISAGTPPRHTDQFGDVSATIMLGETGTADDLWTPRSDTSRLVAPSQDLKDAEDGRPAARHLDRATLAFMDGHVKPMQLNEFYLGQNPLDKWFAP